jgi:hypothetical protein
MLMCTNEACGKKFPRNFTSAELAIPDLRVNGARRLQLECGFAGRRSDYRSVDRGEQ